MDTTRITTYPNPFLVNVPEFQNVIQNAAGETTSDLETRIGQIEEMVMYDTKQIATNSIRSFDSGQIEVLDPILTPIPNTSGTTSSRITGFVDAGIPVTIQNIRVQLSSGGNRSLQIATTDGTITADWNSYGTSTSGYASIDILTSQIVTTTFVYIAPSHTYLSQGDVQYVNVCDRTSMKAYRITCMIGPGYLGNMISIEQL